VILADGLSVRAAEPLRASDVNGLQFVLGEAISQPDVLYVFVRDSRGEVLVSSFETGAFPSQLQAANTLAPGAPFGTEELTIPFRGAVHEVIDVASPVARGTLGTVHVGLNISLLKKKINNLLTTIMAVGIVFLGILSVVTLLFAYRIVSPVRDLMKVAEALGRGELTKTAKIVTGDELGQLGETLNQTIQRLQGLVQSESDRDKMQNQVMGLLSVVSSAAEGDLTTKAEVTADALGSVADAFNLMINGLAQLVTHARNVAGEIRHSTSEILMSSDRMRAGAEQQAMQIRSASESVNNLSLTIQRMAENADAATQASHRATQAAVKGGASVTETIKGMQRIRGSVQSTAKKIKGLGERSLEIGAIIEVINEIATQTNMLALNAAIEAARAGEQGKGFAVVADEVRKLAERAGRATKDITGLIKGIQVETSEAVTVMEEGTREVEEGTRLADQAGTALREIEQIVKQSAGLVTEITRAAGDQVKVTDSVVQSMGTISKVTRETTVGVQETVTTIGKLAELSKQLTDAIGRFKIVADSRSTAPTRASAPATVDFESLPPLAENVTTSEEEIKLGFLE
jgi:methyl-accepting chemotaxis protein